jgi:hypothetical protein
MSNPYKEPVGAASLTVAIALFIGGIAAFGFGSGPQIAMALAALVMVLAASARHDRAHRRMGERPHAMWGLDDRNRPGRRTQRD